MRIGIDARALTPAKMTGIGRYLTNLLKTLLVMDKENEYYLYGRDGVEFSADSDNFKIVKGGPLSTLLWDQVYLPLALKKNNIDLFLSPYYKIPVFAGCRMLLTHHDFIFFSYPEYKKRFVYNFIVKKIIQVFNFRAWKLLCVSNYSKHELLNYFKAPAGKIQVLTESAGPAFYPRPEAETGSVKQKYGLTGGYILYVGNSLPHKNISGLVSAYSMLPEEIRKQYQLVLAGAAVPKQEGVISILGATDAELAALYSGASLFVFPSFMEGFGLPPLEAMSCGCPVISSNAASIPEILGDACLYFEPQDISGMCALISGVLRDASVQDKLRTKGFERAAFYAPEKAAALVLSLFTDQKTS